MNKIKILKIVSILNFFLGMIPIIFLFYYQTLLHDKMSFYGAVIGESYSQSPGTAPWIAVIIISTIIYCSGSIVGYILYLRTGEKKYLSTLLLNGFPIFIFLFIKVKKIRVKTKNIYALICLSAALFVAIGFSISGVIKVTDSKKWDSTFEEGYKEDAEFSVDPANPNVIDIFSDGLDMDAFRKIMNDDMWNELEDFTFFPRFVTRGYFTGSSIFSLLSGDEKYIQSHNRSFSWSKFDIEAKGLNQFNQIGNSELGGDTSIEQAWSGDPKVFHSKHPNVNVLNWTLANKLMGYSNFYKYAPEYAPYAKFIDGAHVGKSSYSFLSDDMTHHPYHINERGEFTIWGSRDKSFSAVANFLINLKEKLSNIYDYKTSNISAWDNTIVFVYGDHGSHHLSQVDDNKAPENGLESRKNISALFVKPLKKDTLAKKPKNIIESREIWAPFVRRIISTSFDRNISTIDFIMKNKNFDSGRVFKTTNTKNTLSYFTNFSSDGQLVVLNGEKIRSLKVSGGVNGWYKNSSVEEKILDGEVEWKN